MAPTDPPARPQSATLQVPGEAAAQSVPTSQNASAAPSIRPPSAIYAPTQVRYEDPNFEKPPPLNYTLRTRKKGIAIFWTLILLDTVAMPIALYFGLWYGTNLSHNAGIILWTAQ